MKSLSKYLNPKSQWHGPKELPETCDLREICEFLDANNFLKVKDPNYISYSQYVRNIKIDEPFYIYIERTGTLFISLGGDYTKTNPLYIIKPSEPRYEAWWINVLDREERWCTDAYSKMRKYLIEGLKLK